MKNKFTSFLLFIVLSLAFVACTKDTDQPGGGGGEEPAAEYTIMMYGCGGETLDKAMLYNLGQVTGYGYSSQVQFAAKLKFSKPYQKENPEIYGGTRLYTLTEKGMTNERVGSQGFRLDDPQNLADFINDTKKRLPAKQYILILWNHGSNFTIKDQLVESSYPEKVVEVDSRAVVFDDNTGETISIFEQEEALKRAGGKLDMIYWDVCLMHTIENICQIKDYTRYVMGAGHLTSGLGGNYALLMRLLERNSNLLTAMEEYIPATVEYWVNIEGAAADDGKDLALSDMEYVDEVTQKLKICVDDLVEYRTSLKLDSADELLFEEVTGTPQYGSEYFSPKGMLYYYDPESTSIDMFSGFTRILNLSYNGNYSSHITNLKLAIDKMIPISHCAGVPNFISRVSLGINWIDKFAFEYHHPKAPIDTFEELYPKLKFDQAVGWSRFLKINHRRPYRGIE